MKQRTAAIVGGATALTAILVFVGVAVVNRRVVCTTSLALPTAPIELSGGTTLVRAVEVCGSAACTFSAGPTASPAPGPASPTLGPASPTPGPADGPATADRSAPLRAFHVDGNEWSVGFWGGMPATATVAVRGDAGRILVSKSFALHWKQIGPTSVCGNGHTTKTLRLAVPGA